MPEMRHDPKDHLGEPMIYLLVGILAVVFFKIKKKPDGTLNHKLWNQVFDHPDHFTKIEWKK